MPADPNQKQEKLRELINTVKLSRREQQVLDRLAAGDIQSRIALDLGISVGRVEIICSNIRKKMNAFTLPAAVGKAVALNLVDPFEKS